MQCNKLCNIACNLNSTAISQYVTLKILDVLSKHVRYIKQSRYVYAAFYLPLTTSNNMAR